MTPTISRSGMFIFGLGFSGQAIVASCRKEFSAIYGTTRSEEKCVALEQSGIRGMVFDGTSDKLLQSALSTVSHVVISIAPDEWRDVVLESCGELLSASSALQWIGYLSTVGVYGDHSGEWVDEETVCKPVSKRSISRVTVENAWQDFAARHDLPLSIFRLSGIYGPGRNAFVNMERGLSRRLVKQGQVFNRIRREDIGTAIRLAAQQKANGIFNITDDEPAPPQDVVTFAHELAGKTPPPEVDFETAELSPMARSFYGENKRVSNEKSKSVLGLSYAYPNYRESLRQLWEEDCWRG